jgi:hypothetical protein
MSDLPGNIGTSDMLREAFDIILNMEQDESFDFALT